MLVSTLPPMARHRRRSLPGLLAVALLPLAACTGGTINSGVSPKTLDEAPFYAGDALTSGRTAWLPVQYQAGGADSPILDPSRDAGSPLQRLLGAMTAYLDSLAPGARLEATPRAPGTPPDVRFGCVRDLEDECDPASGGSGFLEGPRPRVRLEVARPSPDWTAWAAGQLAGSTADQLLLVTLELGEQLPRQRDGRGTKVVALGTGHSVELPWLTSLETPVSVLQLTGAVIGADGRARRIGAEGLVARRTPLVASAFGVQSVVSDEDVTRLLTARREDLPGAPLVWQVALRTLVSGLLDAPPTAVTPVGPAPLR